MKQQSDKQLVCASCSATYGCNDAHWRCSCGGILNLVWPAQFPKALIVKRKPNLWRYREALPIAHDEALVTFEEGYTPLLPLTISGLTVWCKHDYLFPTLSYKDRGATVLVSKLRELHLDRVVEDSSGNAGCAIAAYCARAEISCDIYVPASASQAKLEQIKAYGATLHVVPGSREATATAVLHAAATSYYASHSWNPFFFHGTKTIAYEIWEQLGWQIPDVVIVPVGNGTLLLGAALGFNDLVSAGEANRIPKLVGVQASACAPLFEAFHRGASSIAKGFQGKPTLAEGIAIAEPIRGKQILEAVRRSRGSILTVDEEQVLGELSWLARQGCYVEPTAAATIAGVRKYCEGVRDGEVIVTVLTGHGLKAAGKRSC